MTPVRSALAVYSAAMTSGYLLRMAQGLLVIHWLEPEVLGIWLGLQLIPIYGIHAHFGLLNAVNRQVPFHNGRGEPARAARIVDVVRGDLLLLGVASLAVLGALEAAGQFHGDVGRGVLALTAATILNVGVQFHAGLFRARHEFGRAGALNLLQALILAAGLPLVYRYGFDGLLYRAVATAVLGLALAVGLNRFSLRIAFDVAETRSLVLVGLPIMVLSYGLVIFQAMDRTLILLLLDEQAMGLYAIAFAAAPLTALFPTLIGQVFYPRMTEAYAAGGRSTRVLGLCQRASLTSALFAGGVCLVLWASLPFLVPAFFPKYEPGIPPLNVALLAYWVLSLGSGPNYCLISTSQKRQQFAVLVSAAGLMLVSGFVLAGFGLIGVAWAVVIGSVGYVAGLWAVVIRSMKRPLSSPDPSMDPAEQPIEIIDGQDR